MRRQQMESMRDGALMALVLDCQGTKLAEELAGYSATDLAQQQALGPALAPEMKLGLKKRAQLDAAIELGRRITEKIGPLPVVSAPAGCIPYLQDIRTEQKEHFVCLYLNARNQVVHKEFISIGSLSASIVHPREVFRVALKLEHGVASIILAHNHPSGDTTPSKDDLELTRRLVKAGQLMGIEVLDHLIIGAGEFTSLKEKGLM